MKEGTTTISHLPLSLHPTLIATVAKDKTIKVYRSGTCRLEERPKLDYLSAHGLYILQSDCRRTRLPTRLSLWSGRRLIEHGPIRHLTTDLQGATEDKNRTGVDVTFSINNKLTFWSSLPFTTLAVGVSEDAIFTGHVRIRKAVERGCIMNDRLGALAMLATWDLRVGMTLC